MKNTIDKLPKDQEQVIVKIRGKEWLYIACFYLDSSDFVCYSGFHVEETYKPIDVEWWVSCDDIKANIEPTDDDIKNAIEKQVKEILK